MFFWAGDLERALIWWLEGRGRGFFPLFFCPRQGDFVYISSPPIVTFLIPQHIYFHLYTLYLGFLGGRSQPPTRWLLSIVLDLHGSGVREVHLQRESAGAGRERSEGLQTEQEFERRQGNKREKDSERETHQNGYNHLLFASFPSLVRWFLGLFASPRHSRPLLSVCYLFRSVSHALHPFGPCFFCLSLRLVRDASLWAGVKTGTYPVWCLFWCVRQRGINHRIPSPTPYLRLFFWPR